MVVKPKDQQVKITASHQRRATDRGAGEDDAADKLRSLLGAVARLDGVGFFFALAFRIPRAAFYSDCSSAERCCVTSYALPPGHRSRGLVISFRRRHRERSRDWRKFLENVGSIKPGLTLYV